MCASLPMIHPHTAHASLVCWTLVLCFLSQLISVGFILEPWTHREGFICWWVTRGREDTVKGWWWGPREGQALQRNSSLLTKKAHLTRASWESGQGGEMAGEKTETNQGTIPMAAAQVEWGADGGRGSHPPALYRHCPKKGTSIRTRGFWDVRIFRGWCCEDEEKVILLETGMRSSGGVLGLECAKPWIWPPALLSPPPHNTLPNPTKPYSRRKIKYNRKILVKFGWME